MHWPLFCPLLTEAYSPLTAIKRQKRSFYISSIFYLHISDKFLIFAIHNRYTLYNSISDQTLY